MFQRQDAGTDFRGRRELDRASVRFHFLKNYGAMMTGMHRFRHRDTCARTETARFVHLWKFDHGSWKLARHQL